MRSDSASALSGTHGWHKMTQNDAIKRPRKATTQNLERAAQLVASDYLIDERISAEVGISRRTLARWKHDATFQARVAAIREAYRAQLRAEGLAKIERWSARVYGARA